MGASYLKFVGGTFRSSEVFEGKLLGFSVKYLFAVTSKGVKVVGRVGDKMR